MRIALDPFMHRFYALGVLPATVTVLGFDRVELSARAVFFEWFCRPSVDPVRIKSFTT